MRAVGVMVVAGITACAPGPAETLRDPRPAPQPTDPDELARTIASAEATRGQRLSPPRVSPRYLKKPTLAPLPIPDPRHDLLRWPLSGSEHPELTPQFEIAAALAEPGVDWTDLCRMGAHKRLAGAKLRDELAYLRAWCAVASRDTDAALTGLAKLRTSVVRGLGPAARQDIVNVLLDVGDSAQVSRLLERHRLMEADTLDLLAAMYLDMGRDTDGYEINARALGVDSRAHPERRCRRLARAIAIDPDRHRKALLPDAPVLGESFEHPACKRIEAELACWLAPDTGCLPWFQLTGLDVNALEVRTAHRMWPDDPSSGDWLPIALRAKAAFPHPDAWEIATRAIENLVIQGGCATPRTLVKWIDWLDAYGPPAPFDARVARMKKNPSELCP